MCQNNSNLVQILEEKFVLVDSNMEFSFHVPGIEDKHVNSIPCKWMHVA
jgi:hypothetical protein